MTEPCPLSPAPFVLSMNRPNSGSGFEAYVHDSRGRLIALVPRLGGLHGPPTAEARANARLFAAAPDLLRAATAALHALRCVQSQLHPEYPDGWCDQVDALRNAIDAAEGRAEPRAESLDTD